jgi:hypothetical protein
MDAAPCWFVRLRYVLAVGFLVALVAALLNE